MKEAGTVTYFAGWMIGSITPIVGILPDIRDTVQAAVNGNIVPTIIGLASIAPGLGTGGDVAQIGHYAKKWAKLGGSTVKKAVSYIKNGILSKIPGDLKKKILNGLSDGKKAKNAEKISKTKMQRYIDEGYNPAQIDDMVKNGKFTKEDIDLFTKKRVNLDRVQTLKGRNIPVDDIRYYVKHDVSLHKVADMRNQKFSADRIRALAKQGFDFDEAKHLKREGFTNDDVMVFADNGIKPAKARQLKYEGFARENIVDLASRGANFDEASKLKRGGFSADEINWVVAKSDRTYLYNNKILEKVRKRHEAGIPKDDLKYYVDNGVSLWIVKKLHRGGNTAGDVKKGLSKYVKQSSVGTRKTVSILIDNQRIIVPSINAVLNGYTSTKVRKNSSS